MSSTAAASKRTSIVLSEEDQAFCRALVQRHGGVDAAARALGIAPETFARAGIGGTLRRSNGLVLVAALAGAREAEER